MPACSYCAEPARYDHIITTVDGNRGAFLCVDHAQNLVTRLGAPDGTVYMFRQEEVTPDVQRRVNARLVELGREPLFARSRPQPLT